MTPSLASNGRFLGEEDEGISMSTYPILEVNSVPDSYRRGVVNRGTSVQIPVEILKTISNAVQLDTEIGYTWHRDSRGASCWSVAMLTGWKVISRASVMAEIYTAISRSLDIDYALVNLGSRYQINNHVVLIASVGTGFAGVDRPRLVAYFGTALLP
jgi:hypothetical protein